MLELEFAEYLRNVRLQQESTIGSRISNCKRVEQYEGDLDEHFDRDQCQSLLGRLSYTTRAQDLNLRPNHNIPIKGDIRNGSATLKQAVTLYQDFRRGAGNKPTSNHASKGQNPATTKPTGRCADKPRLEIDARPGGKMKTFKQMSEIELLQTHGAVIDELLRRGVVKTRNNPIGDYTEWLVCNRLGLKIQPNSKASFDAIDANGIRYQIKGRRDEANSVQFSAIRNLDDQGFDLVIAVVFNSDYSVRLAVIIPHDMVPEFARYQQHTNAHNLILTESVLHHDGVMDIRQLLI